DVTVTPTNQRVDFSLGLIFVDLEICNVSTSDLQLVDPFWYAHPSNATTFLWQPDGETNGLPYVDVTHQVTSQLAGIGNGNNALETNECVLVTNVAFYHVSLSPISGTVFAVFADASGGGVMDPDLRDTDGDCMLNYWEDANGLNKNWPNDALFDPDGDRRNNVQEFFADTDPRDGNSVLDFIWISADPSGADLQWTGGRSVTQYLECAESPEGPWTTFYTNLPPTAVTGGVSDVFWDRPLRFYRIRVDKRRH
ncbi:MAG: hypothetical protein AAF492_02470, partial [Verrucomicrobiota bacterium]